tara:strand:+ start:4602 stop:5030 length:429 start_codon:yes stop_codon:yes gene_type:complete
MGIIAGMTDSFKEQLLKKEHDLEDDTLKIALYTKDASIGPNTTIYTTSGEVSGTNYTAGGNVLSGKTITVSGGTVYVDFNDSTWSSATVSDVSGALIYNSTAGLKSIAVLDFGVSGGISVNASDFKVKFPSATADDAIIRIS